MNSKYVKRFIKAMAIQIAIIILFSLIYYSIINDFKSLVTTGAIEFIDCLLLSSATQSGIGITNILPQTQLSKSLTVIQQIISIMAALYIVFAFNMDP